jgi:hypothetical protein
MGTIPVSKDFEALLEYGYQSMQGTHIGSKVNSIYPALSLLQVCDQLEPKLVLNIVEEACQQYGTTTNKIHTKRDETIKLIWEEIYLKIIIWRRTSHHEN